MINLSAPAGPFGNPALALAAPLGVRSMWPSLVLVRIAAESAGAMLAVLLVALTSPHMRARAAFIPATGAAGTRAPRA